MSKTIIITTDEMKKFLMENFGHPNIVLDYYCRCCREQHNGCFCEEEDIDCTVDSSEDIYEFFIEHKLANYMIPFS